MTKNVLILGAGTAGALVANTLVRKPDLSPWEVTVVDRAREHTYTSPASCSCRSACTATIGRTHSPASVGTVSS